MEDNIKVLLDEFDPEDWNVEGKKLIRIAAKIVNSLNDKFTLEEIEAFCTFLDGNEWAPSIMRRMIEKQIRIIRHEPDEPNHKPLTFYARDRAYIQKLNKSWDCIL